MIKVTDKRSGSLFQDAAQEKRILETRATNRWNSLPRYIKRAFHSKNKLYIEKAIIKAIRNGWTIERLKECVPQDKVKAVKTEKPVPQEKTNVV